MRKVYVFEETTYISMEQIHEKVIDYIKKFDMAPDRLVIPFEYYTIATSSLGIGQAQILEQGKKFSPYILGPGGLIEIICDLKNSIEVEVINSSNTNPSSNRVIFMLENKEAMEVDKILLGTENENTVHRGPTSEDNSV